MIEITPIASLRLQCVCRALIEEHLGNLEFDRSPERAIVHYEMGIRIAELSLPRRFDGLLDWGNIFNRPFLRCLNGYGLCLWRRGDFTGAQGVFERILAFSPTDN